MTDTEDKLEFRAWPKIPRYKNMEVTITEKMDGTNAAIIIKDGVLVGCQSRSRLIQPGNDNFGFAKWAHENKEALANFLGDGYHYGEWTGLGIQKDPHRLNDKFFYLFNTRWVDAEEYPPNVRCVRILYQGRLKEDTVNEVLNDLEDYGHDHAYIPEGIVIFYHSMRTAEKLTFEHRKGKWRG